MQRIFAFLSLSLGGLGFAAGDSVELVGGGQLTGSITRGQDYVVVKIDDEIQVAIPNSRVRRVVKSDELAEYRRNAEKAADDPEVHYQLAIWCVTDNHVPGLAQYYKRFHMQRTIELDPDHAQARASLGYKKHNGKWVRTSDLMRDRGMVTVAGRWELPEAVALEELQETTEVDAKKWIREVSRLVGIAVRGNNAKSQEAWATLEAIKDPLAASAIARQLLDSRGAETQSRQLRMLWVKLLGQFQNRVSVEALVRAGIDESDATIREACLEELLRYGSGSAVATYLPMLTSNNNSVVNRAARALSWFPNPELALTYVDALVTNHRTEIAPGPGMQVGFGDNGGGGLSMGGKAKVIQEDKANPAALALIRKIEPNVDFGYDEDKWRLYFANQRIAFSGDLRRDP